MRKQKFLVATKVEIESLGVTLSNLSLLEFDIRTIRLKKTTTDFINRDTH